MATCWWVVQNASTGKRSVVSGSCDPTFTSSAGMVVGGPYTSAAAAASGGASGGPAVTQTAGCGPEAIYTALLSAGFTQAQAVGAMANAINESNLNPETPAGDGGTSFGLWQFHNTSYPDAPHPTGNCAHDIAAAVGYLKTHVSGSALNGQTGAQVAGNFAANFERCQGCQPGGAQYNQRVANAATVEGWIASGHWPAGSSGGSGGSGGSSGSGGTGSGGTGSGGTGSTPASTPASTSASGAPNCLWSVPIVGCVLTASEARAMIGGLMLAGAAVIGLAAAAVLVAAGFAGTGAGKAVTQVAQATPAGRVAKVAGRAAKPTRVSTPREPRLERAETTREVRARTPAALRAAARKPAPRPAPARREVADRRGTSPEFRRRYLGEGQKSS